MANGDQNLVGRQDLLRYGQAKNIPAEMAPLLSPFSREMNAPYWEPDAGRPRNSEDAERLNPGILSVRFDESTSLGWGGVGEVTVPSGTPVLARRFPLSKLDLLENYTPELEDEVREVRYYFGLENMGRGFWSYVDGVEVQDEDGNYVGTRIADLQEVADMGREPNFFEVLQAVLLTDSLGKHAGDAVIFSEARDSARNLQVLQIGANIIDQWDGDDIPTTIQFPSGVQNDPIEIYGVENLPYINHFATVPFRPTYDRDLIQAWLLFDLWNPHQNAFRPPTGIGPDLRIVVECGPALPPFILLNTWLTRPAPINGWPLPNGAYAPSLVRRTTLWEEVRSRWPDAFTVPAFIPPVDRDPGYLEPRAVGLGGARPQEPTAANSTPPGFLLVEYDLRQQSNGVGTRPSTAGIAPKQHRTRAQQIELNDLLDTISAARYEAQGSFSHDPANGDRVYPTGSRLRNVQDTLWACVPPLPPAGGDGWSELLVPTRVYANFAPFAYNHIQIRLGDLEIKLQALVDGQWRTYQRIDEFSTTENPGSRIDLNEPFRTLEDAERMMVRTTQHSEADADTSGSFYTWRKWFDTNPALTTIENGGIAHTFTRMDPRSMRFGVSRALIDGVGFSPRNTTAAWNRTATNSRDNWMVTRGLRAGFGSNDIPVNGFEGVARTNGQPHFGSAFAGLVTNHPTELSGSHPLRYPDRDGVIRPGDGFWGSFPTLSGRAQQRPLILNRPFRSVGELGYVFRDVPWKTMDFSSRYSADLGLLDFFSIEDTKDPIPVLAGRVNLNSASVDVLTVLLAGSAERLEESTPANGGQIMSEERARSIAQRIVAEREENGPYLSRGDLVGRVFHHPTAPHPFGTQNPVVKAEREAAIRTLSGVGNLRTWNLMIDLVVQDGRFGPAASSMNDFLVQGSKRYWIHVALDRLTGEVVDLQREVVEIP